MTLPETEPARAGAAAKCAWMLNAGQPPSSCSSSPTNLDDDLTLNTARARQLSGPGLSCHYARSQFTCPWFMTLPFQEATTSPSRRLSHTGKRAHACPARSLLGLCRSHRAVPLCAPLGHQVLRRRRRPTRPWLHAAGRLVHPQRTGTNRRMEPFALSSCGKLALTRDTIPQPSYDVRYPFHSLF
jgi:hypothetical protein